MDQRLSDDSLSTFFMIAFVYDSVLTGESDILPECIDEVRMLRVLKSNVE